MDKNNKNFNKLGKTPYYGNNDHSILEINMNYVMKKMHLPAWKKQE